MQLKRITNVLKSKQLYVITANKAGVLENLLFLLFFRTQISKGVNDDTENEVEDDNDDDEVKE